MLFNKSKKEKAKLYDWITSHVQNKKKMINEIKQGKLPFDFLQDAKVLESRKSNKLSLWFQFKDSRSYLVDIGGNINIYGQDYYDPNIVRMINT